MGRVQVISLDDTYSSECERLRYHSINLGPGERRQFRQGGFFRYFDFVSDEHFHWGVTDGVSLIGMVSLALVKEGGATVVLLTDFFTSPEERHRASSRALIRQIHRFLESQKGPLVLVAIESRYRLLDPLIAIAERFEFVFKADRVVESIALDCRSNPSPFMDDVQLHRVSDLSESQMYSVMNFSSDALIWPSRSSVLARVKRIDPEALFLLRQDLSTTSWAILFSEQRYRTYEAVSHMNMIASDARLIVSAQSLAQKRRCDWLLMRRPFPNLSLDDWPKSTRYVNRVFVGRRDGNRAHLSPELDIHLLQGLTL